MKGTKGKHTTIEYYKCPECGFVFPIQRIQKREKGHIKDLWCIRCEKIQKMDKVVSETH